MIAASRPPSRQTCPQERDARVLLRELRRVHERMRTHDGNLKMDSECMAEFKDVIKTITNGRDPPRPQGAKEIMQSAGRAAVTPRSRRVRPPYASGAMNG